MNLTKPAKILISCGVFFLFFLFTSYLDTSLILAASVYLFLSAGKYLYLFIASFIVFLMGIFMHNLDISYRFISDLMIDAYILFVTATVLYLRTKKDFVAQVHEYYKAEKKLFSKEIFFRLGLGTIVVFLLFPIFGGYIAAVLGYIIFSFLSRQFNGKIAIGLGLFILILAAFFLLFQKEATAEELGNYVYLFLVIGTIQEVLNLARHRADSEEEEKSGEKAKNEQKNLFSMPVLPRLDPKIFWGVIAFGLSLFLIYLLLLKFPLSVPKLDFKTPVPTPTPTALPSPLPTVFPTPVTEVSTSAAKLKILVLNGTEIAGLAGSTSAKLKKAGFKNIEIGNTKTTDYKNWELLLKKHDEELIGILKNILDLETLTEKEASLGAKFDIEIIAGENK